MNTAFADFLTALYAQTNRKPQLVSDKLCLHLIERVNFIEGKNAFVMNVIVRDNGNGQMRVGLLSFGDSNTGKNYIVTRAGFPHVPTINGKTPTVMPDGSIVFAGIDLPISGTVARDALTLLSNAIVDLIIAHNEHEAKVQAEEAQKAAERVSAHVEFLHDAAERTGCSQDRVQSIYDAIAGDSPASDKIYALVVTLAEREGKLMSRLKRISNDLDEVARDLWQETKASHLARKCEKLVADLQETAK